MKKMTALHSVIDLFYKCSLESTDQIIRVLNVDDEASFLKITKQILEMQDLFQVETASSVNEAMQKMGEKSFDVIVSDHQMPEKTGMDFLKELRENGNNIPFILFTGKGREEIAIEALNLGADYYFNKSGKTKTVYGELAHGIRVVVKAKKAEEKLKESEMMYRLLTENITDTIFIQDMNLNVKYVSPSVEKLSGYTPEEVLKIRPENFMTPESCERGVADFKEAIALVTKKPDAEIPFKQYEYICKDGSTFWGELKTKLLRDSMGRLVGLHGTLRDITERKKTAEKLKESEKKYRLLTENTTDVVFIQGLDLSINYVSPSVEALSGYTPEEVMAMGPKCLMTDESFERGLIDIRNAFSLAAKNPDLELPFWRYDYVRKDGSTVWGEFKAKLLRDSEGRFVGMQGTLRDITERKKAEDALRQERKMLELVTTNIGTGLTIISKDYKILWANKFLRTICGDVTGKTCYSTYNDRTRVCPGCGVKEIFETGKDHVVHEQLVPSSNGQRAWIELTANPIRDEKGNIIAASEVSVYLNEHKEMEQKLREAEKRYHALFDKAPLGISIVDSNGTAVEFNDEAHRQLGYSREEFEKLTVSDYEVLETRDEIRARMRKILKSGKDEFETKYRTKNGEIRDLINTVQVIELDGKRFFHVITRDITERNTAEESIEEVMKELVMINEKLGVVGKLTRHDARNKLSVIVNNIYLAKKQLASNHNVLEYLDDVESAVDQMEKIFSFARTYEMLGVEDLSYVDVKNCVDEAVSLFSGMNEVKLVNDCSGLAVLADSLLQQLFFNLIDDSLKYGEKVSQIRVYYEEGEGQLKLIYEDNGIGISKDEKEKIFRESYGKGTGYGLYLIRKICEAYGWTITETGKHGKGAQFTMIIAKMGKNKKLAYRL